MPASFGPPFVPNASSPSSSPLLLENETFVWADPPAACSPLVHRSENEGEEAVRIIVVMRGECSFGSKARFVQQSDSGETIRLMVVVDHEGPHNETALDYLVKLN